ncbi:hypothetical protein ACU61A_27255 [Pseudonocardia sichuanensis]
MNTADELFRDGGQVQPPTMYLLDERQRELPYLGGVQCRPFYRGADAAQAVTAMGLVASMAEASRLVMTWEFADLAVALQQPGAEVLPNALMVLDADQTQHTLRFHPVQLHLSPGRVDGAPVVRPEWGHATHHRDADLPTPVADLLAIWRSPHRWSEAELVGTYDDLRNDGYAIRWTSRPEGEPRRPAWMQLLAAPVG